MTIGYDRSIGRHVQMASDTFRAQLATSKQHGSWLAWD